MGTVGPTASLLLPKKKKTHQELPMEQDRVGFSQAAVADTPWDRGWWVGTSPMHLHYTVPTVLGPHSPPSCHLFPSQDFILLPVAPAPQCVTLNPTKPITLTVYFSPNAPLCSSQCLILHPSMQHPKSTTAAPPHPRGHPISSACSSFPDPLTYHPSPTSCMHLHATPPSEPLIPFSAPHTCYPAPSQAVSPSCKHLA